MVVNRDIRPARLAQYWALAVPALLLCGAYISEYGFGLYPCEMCWWQRWPHFAALAFAILSFTAPPNGRGLHRISIGLAMLAILASGVIGGFHAGVEYGWWEGITGCALAAGTGAGGGNALDAIMHAPMIRCDQSPWDFLGLSLAGWNGVISTGSAAVIGACLVRSSQAKDAKDRE